MKAAMVERYPDPSIEDPQINDKLLTLPVRSVRKDDDIDDIDGDFDDDVDDDIGGGNGDGW